MPQKPHAAATLFNDWLPREKRLQSAVRHSPVHRLFNLARRDPKRNLRHFFVLAVFRVDLRYFRRLRTPSTHLCTNSGATVVEFGVPSHRRRVHIANYRQYPICLYWPSLWQHEFA